MGNSKPVAQNILDGTTFEIKLTEDLEEQIKYDFDDYEIAIFTQAYHHLRSDYIPIHWHNALQIIWVYQGSLEYQINNKIITITENSLLLINNRQLHSSKTINQNANVLCMNFNLDFLHPKLLSAHVQPFFNKNPFAYYLLPLSLEQKTKMSEWINDKKPNFFSVVAFLTTLIEHLLTHYDVAMKNNEENEIALFNQMLQFVQENYQNSITVNDLASCALINKNACNQLFQKYTRLSPIKFVNKHRLYIAQGLILHTNKSISEISEEAGFNQVSYFVELFRKNYHLAPLQYRNKYRVQGE
ncbi:helix-turn-helix domain-containing protein [Bacillus ndiopicus]|uniref:helix-turn-helix domain-containing protein n=1 Tax=Bacillus ndiopicus TaxID=1347368 RepID=UPI000694F71D|nr:helix-turn-helix domain-containing protein [Bacillus ndiopicus]